MIIYRPHRGSLDEAMRECKEFESLDDMKKFICDQWSDMLGGQPFRADDISIGERPINDRRIGWEDCRHVLVSRVGNERFPFSQCIGWCATIYKKAGE